MNADLRKSAFIRGLLYRFYVVGFGEDRVMRFMLIDGINAPWIIDHYIEGKQATRINYESVQYNQALADTLFAKRDNIKAIK